jgi:hypothetical protein
VSAGDWHFFPLEKMWRHSMYMLALRGAPPGGVLGKFFFLQAVTCIGVSHSFAINVKGWAPKQFVFVPEKGKARHAWRACFFLSLSSLAIWVVIIGESSSSFFALECVG